MGLTAEQALILGERVFDFDIPRQHRGIGRNAHALRRFPFRYQKIPNTVFRHDAGRLLCQSAPQVFRPLYIVSAHIGTIR
jgi:hypothetical protein